MPSPPHQPFGAVTLNPRMEKVLFMTSEPLLTERDAAKLLNISPRSVKNARMSGVLPFIKIGRLVRYRREDIFSSLNVFRNGQIAAEVGRRRTVANAFRASGIRTFTEQNAGR